MSETKRLEKQFTTYDEQVQILLDKKLVITNIEHAKYILKKTSYFALINGYKRLFKENNKTGDYKKGACFEDIVKLYDFDCELRAWVTRYVLIVERKLKSLISYYFSEKHQSEKNFYLEKSNYRYSNINDRIEEDVAALIEKFKQSTDNHKYRYINHYDRNHDKDIPLWVVVCSLSFGKVSKLFELCLPGIQNKVCNEYDGVKPTEMVNMLSILTKFRNVSAHNERIYDYQTHDKLENMCIHSNLGVPKTKEGIHSSGTKDLFAVLIAFKCLLDPEDFDQCFLHLKRIDRGFFI